MSKANLDTQTAKIIKANQYVVHIKHTITLRQYKYWFLLIKLYKDLFDMGEKPNEKGFYFVPISKISEYLGYEPQKAELKADFRALRQEPIVVNYLEKDGKNAIHEMGFISEFKITSNQIAFKFPSLIVDYVEGKSNVKELFTLLNWDIFNSFSGKYEAIIYKLCKDYIGVKRTPYFTIQEYREYIGLKDSEYLIFKAFNRRTISAPIKNINESEYSDIFIDVVFKKEGRTVVGLHFEMKYKENIKLLENESKDEKNPVFEKSRIPISSEKQVDYLSKYTVEEIKAIINRVNKYIDGKKSKGEPANVGSLYHLAFAEGWGLEDLRLEKEEKQKKQKLKDKEKAKKEAEERERVEQQSKKEADIHQFYLLSEEEQMKRINFVIDNSAPIMAKRFKQSFDEFGLAILEKSGLFYAEYDRLMSKKYNV